MEKDEKYRCLNRLKTVRNRIILCEELTDKDKVLDKLRNRTSVQANVAALASMCKVQFVREYSKAAMSNEDEAKLTAWRSVNDLMDGRDENCAFLVVRDIMEETFALSEELCGITSDLKRYRRATLLEILKGDTKRKVRGSTALELVEVFETIECRPQDILTIEAFITRVDKIADFTFTIILYSQITISVGGRWRRRQQTCGFQGQRFSSSQPSRCTVQSSYGMCSSLLSTRNSKTQPSA